jgi:hypothetical protein
MVEMGTFVPLMNNTKWRKLRLAMLTLRNSSPAFRTRNLKNDYETGWDSEWYHHFLLPDYAFIEWLDLKPRRAGDYEEIHSLLKRCRLPGEAVKFGASSISSRRDSGFRIFGYVPVGEPADYIR